MQRHLSIKHWFVMLTLSCFLGLFAHAQVSTTTNNGPATEPPATTRDGDITNGELANMDRFLDRHPEIAEQLHKDPSLINNREFVENHPALQSFLQDHPLVRQEVRENPNAFLAQENAYDRREDSGDRDRGDRDRGAMANMDRFLDGHPEIAEQLRKDPSLVNNRKFVENHPALQQFLQSHPEVREDMRDNPNAFMRQENRYDRAEDSRSRDSATGFGDRDRQDPATGARDREPATTTGDRDNRATATQMTTTRDRENREATNFGEFLNQHSSVSAELSKNPSLVNNKEFMATHPELQEYLTSHPATQQQLTANPQAFMKSVPVTSRPRATQGPTTVPNPKENH